MCTQNSIHTHTSGTRYVYIDIARAHKKQWKSNLLLFYYFVKLTSKSLDVYTLKEKKTIIKQNTRRIPRTELNQVLLDKLTLVKLNCCCNDC